MLNIWANFRGTTDQRSICPADPGIQAEFRYVSGSIGKSDLSQKNLEKSDHLNQKTFIYDDHKRGGWEGVREICPVSTNSAVFEHLIYCSFLQRMGVGGQNISHFL